MPDEKKPPSLADMFVGTGPGVGTVRGVGGLGAPYPSQPAPAPALTEELIARAVARGIAEAFVPGPPSERDTWLQLTSGPAPLATRVAMIPYQGVIRVSFGEQYDTGAPVTYRAAVTLPDYNAWELWKILGQTKAVQYWEEKYQEEQKKAGDGS